MTYCTKCGNELIFAGTYMECPRCGARFGTGAPHPKTQDDSIQNSVSQKKNSDGLAIASLILGIMSIVFSFGFPGLLIFPCAFGIPAIILGNSALKYPGDKTGLAKGGKICGIVGIVSGVLWMIAYIGFFALMFSEFGA